MSASSLVVSVSADDLILLGVATLAVLLLRFLHVLLAQRPFKRLVGLYGYL